MLWEMHEQGNRSVYYRASGGPNGSWTTGCEWPEELYEEREVITLGIMVPLEEPMNSCSANESSRVDHVDLKLDPVAVNQLFEEARLRYLEALANTRSKKL
jgi:hypothetical protein